MKRLLVTLLILTLSIVCISCSGGKSSNMKDLEPIPKEIDNTTWTIYSMKHGDKFVSIDEYVKTHDDKPVKYIRTIGIKGNTATLEECTYSDKEDWTLNKNAAQADSYERACGSKDSKLYIDGKEYKVEADPELFSMVLVSDSAKYILDYGVRGKTFEIDKVYKGDDLVYDSEKDDIDVFMIYVKKPDNTVTYEFTMDGVRTGNGKLADPSYSLKDLDHPEIEIEHDDKGLETAVYDRASDTLTIERNGLKRVYKHTTSSLLKSVDL